MHGTRTSGYISVRTQHLPFLATSALTCVSHLMALDLAGIAKPLGTKVALVLQVPGVPLLVRAQRGLGAVALPTVAARILPVLRRAHRCRLRILRHSR